MHPDEPVGRIGTIDAGDMVLLVKVNTKDDVIPRGTELGGAYANPGYYHYGDYGDVIIYRPYGKTDRDQIIHRAMCWIELNEEGTYTVQEYGIENDNSITIPELGLEVYRPSHSGFITKGDNNRYSDQASYLCDEPIKVEWISGKARSELPWIGTINLLFNDLFNGKSTVGNVPQDSLICLVLLIAGLVSIPISLDVYDYYKSKKKEKSRKFIHPFDEKSKDD
jgi:signal peptidase